MLFMQHKNLSHNHVNHDDKYSNKQDNLVQTERGRALVIRYETFTFTTMTNEAKLNL